MESVEIYPTPNGKVCFSISEEFINKYDVSLDEFVNGAPVKEALYDELFDMAKEKYNYEFDRDSFFCDMSEEDGRATVTIKPKGNSKIINYFDYNDEAFWVEQFRRLMSIDDDKIFLGLMTTEEKRKELERLRTDREYLRQYLIKNELI